MAEFSCDNGDSYLKTVMVPTACENVPCEEITVSTSWNKDYFWTQEDRKFIQTTVTTDEPILWGKLLSLKELVVFESGGVRIF